MFKKRLAVFLLLSACVFFTSCSKTVSKPNTQSKKIETEKSTEHDLPQRANPQRDRMISSISDINQLKKSVIEKYKNPSSHEWGEKVPGVKTHINTDKRVIALTFDACGGKKGSGYDSELIGYLNKEKISATLFINSKWIDENYNTFMELSKNTLFEIENHGLLHQPLSVNGKSAYNIQGTKNTTEAADEVLLNEQKIEKITGRKPKYFRSGTNYYDETAVNIANDLGQQVIGYSVLGDAGATYTANQVKKACLSAKPGSIIIFHMNHPEKYTAEGIIEAIPQLKKAGYEFVKLEDYDSILK